LGVVVLEAASYSHRYTRTRSNQIETNKYLVLDRYDERYSMA